MFNSIHQIWMAHCKSFENFWKLIFQSELEADYLLKTKTQATLH